MSEQTWKVIDLLKTTADFFKEKNIENPRLNAEVLLSHVLRMDRVKLYVQFERPLSEKELVLFRNHVSRRSKSEPLQYIVGSTEFMGLPFFVDPSVLIPRPETEVLVEEVLKIKELYQERATILDIGTGSGCIAISLAHYWENSKVTGIDISNEAVDTAIKNSIINKVENAYFIRNDIFKFEAGQIPNHFSVIVSNPPYITENEIASLQPEVKDFEPRLALTDFGDGMRFYKYIMNLIQNGTLSCDYIFFEMSGSQPEKIVAEAKKRNFTAINVFKDLTRTKRVLKIKV